MAIYDVDAIREQEDTMDDDSILNSMLEACENMMCVLDESKARRRTYDALMKGAERHANNAKAYADLEKAARNVGNERLREKYGLKFEDNYEKGKELNRKADIIKGTKVNNRGNDMDIDVLDDQIAEKEFKHMYNATPAKDGRKPGYYKDLYEKKKTIKETCLTILSVIDDI